MSVAEQKIVQTDTKQIEAAQKAFYKQFSDAFPSKSVPAKAVNPLDKQHKLPEMYTSGRCESLEECLGNAIVARVNLDYYKAKIKKDGHSAASDGAVASMKGHLNAIGLTLKMMPDYNALVEEAKANALAIVQDPGYQFLQYSVALKVFGVDKVIVDGLDKSGSGYTIMKFMETMTSVNKKGVTVSPFDPKDKVIAENDLGAITVYVGNNVPFHIYEMFPTSGPEDILKAFEKMGPDGFSKTYVKQLTGDLLHEYNHNVKWGLATTGLLKGRYISHSTEGVLGHGPGGMNEKMTYASGYLIDKGDLTGPNKDMNLLYASLISLSMDIYPEKPEIVAPAGVGE